MIVAIELDGGIKEISGEILELKRDSKAVDDGVSVAKAEDEPQDIGMKGSVVVDVCAE